MKGIKDILDLDLSSYFIKKVLLTDEVKNRIRVWNKDELANETKVRREMEVLREKPDQRRLNQIEDELIRIEKEKEKILHENIHFCLHVNHLKASFKRKVDYTRFGEPADSVPIFHMLY